MAVLAVQDMNADMLYDILRERYFSSEIDVLEISDGLAKIEINKVECNTIAMYLVHGIAEKKDIEKILIERNLIFKWL